MFLTDALWALILAFALGLLLTAAFGVRGPWEAPWAIFLVLFLFIWAGGVWATPVGPPLFGVYWLPFVLFGVLLVLLIAAGSEPRPRGQTTPVARERAEEVNAAVGLSAFFWILILALLVAILGAYL